MEPGRTGVRRTLRREALPSRAELRRQREEARRGRLLRRGSIYLALTCLYVVVSYLTTWGDGWDRIDTAGAGLFWVALTFWIWWESRN